MSCGHTQDKILLPACRCRFRGGTQGCRSRGWSCKTDITGELHRWWFEVERLGVWHEGPQSPEGGDPDTGKGNTMADEVIQRLEPYKQK